MNLAIAICLAVSAAASTSETPVEVVTRLYRDFAWETVIEEPLRPGKSFVELPKAELERYVDDNLATLIVRDEECAARTHGICCLDMIPLWAAQDVGATNVRITPTSQPGLVNVRFRYGTRSVALKFHLVMTLRGWRIADIDYPSEPSLLQQLKCK